MKEHESHKVFKDEVQFPRRNDDVQQQPLCTRSGMLRGAGSSHSSRLAKFFLPSAR